MYTCDRKIGKDLFIAMTLSIATNSRYGRDSLKNSVSIWLMEDLNLFLSMSQSEGPVYTMDELAAYFASPSPRKPLLNVVSLDLANTKLHDMVIH